MKKQRLKLLVVSFTVIILLPVTANLMMTEGDLPSEETALAIRKDVIAFSRSNSEKLITDHFNCLSSRKYPDGVTLIFRRKYSEDYGYYFAYPESLANTLPKDILPYTKKITEDLYFYYNPG